MRRARGESRPTIGTRAEAAKPPPVASHHTTPAEGPVFLRSPPGAGIPIRQQPVLLLVQRPSRAPARCVTPLRARRGPSDGANCGITDKNQTQIPPRVISSESP